MRIAVLGSGSGGNSIVVEGVNGTRIMVDAGFSYANLSRRLSAAGIKPSSIYGVLFTHEHGDHAKGSGVFHKKHAHVPFYANSLTAESISAQFGAPMDAFYEFSTGETFGIGEFNIQTFATSHDVVDPVGYFIEDVNGTKLFIGTDTGVVTAGMAKWYSKATCAVLEANYDPTLLWGSSRERSLKVRIDGPNGHLSNEASAELVATRTGRGMKVLLAAHRSQECNEPSLVKAAMAAALAQAGRSDVELALLEQDGILAKEF